jgi:glutamine amidotransferase
MGCEDSSPCLPPPAVYIRVTCTSAPESPHLPCIQLLSDFPRVSPEGSRRRYASAPIYRKRGVLYVGITPNPYVRNSLTKASGAGQTAATPNRRALNCAFSRTRYSIAVIALLDYGSGNLRSVHKALLQAQAQVRIVRQPSELADARAAVLPGVGAFDDCVRSLEKQELLEGVRRFIESDRPFLGICVGYQALFEKSEEFNSCAAGLSLFRGNVVRFTEANGLKIPQIGWNQIEVVQPDCPLFRGIADGSYFYFVHSFFPKPLDESIVATRTVYGDPFASSIWHKNVFATQFHPEKSQAAGLQLLKNFVELSK